MADILIFGGTTEGRKLAEFCCKLNYPADVSVTTDYGESLIQKNNVLRIFNGRLDAFQIEELIRKNGYTAVIDATHPYAVDATSNIRAACEKTFTKYIRIIREQNQNLRGTVINNLTEAVEYLNSSNKRILSTLGSKEIPMLTKVKGYAERLWVRVLPSAEIMCCELDKSHIIAEKPPFSLERNISHIRMSGAEILLTKECGKAGGYEEKIRAAEICQIEVITIPRPSENGYTLRNAEDFIITLAGEANR